MSFEEGKKFMNSLGEYGITTGVSMRVRLKIDKVLSTSEQTIYEKEIFEEEFTSSGRSGFAKRIDLIPLKPGFYRVVIKSLKDVSELTGHPITLGIYQLRNMEPLS